jgi:hypothetical protein
MADEEAFSLKDVDLDEPTLATIREQHRELLELRSRARDASGDERRRLASELIALARRQEALVSEVPGLEEYARRLEEARDRAEKRFGP